jgi:D-sedoheptulose 7-phosphate isomerase
MRRSIEATAEVLQALRTETAPAIAAAAELLAERLRRGGKILICGNGGSAADSQHMATELAVRYLRARSALPAVALTCDTSILTAAANDLGFEHVFSRQVEALGRPEDALIAISTSGTSPNVLRAVETARARGLVTIALTGAGGGTLGPLADHWIGVPSDHTPRVQEAHLVVEHLLCEALEAACPDGGA